MQGRVVLFLLSLRSAPREAGDQGCLIIKCLPCALSLFLMSLKEEVISLLPWGNWEPRGAVSVLGQCRVLWESGQV